FIILGLERRRLMFANVTTNPTADWLAQQVVNAFPWDTAPSLLIRDHDGANGLALTARVKVLASAKSAPPYEPLRAGSQSVGFTSGFHLPVSPAGFTLTQGAAAA